MLYYCFIERLLVGKILHVEYMKIHLPSMLAIGVETINKLVFFRKVSLPLSYYTLINYPIHVHCTLGYGSLGMMTSALICPDDVIN